jgi:hypothetical protein
MGLLRGLLMGAVRGLYFYCFPYVLNARYALRHGYAMTWPLIYWSDARLRCPRYFCAALLDLGRTRR